jgi:flagellin
LSQQTKNVNLGPEPGTEAGFSFKNIRTSNLGQGVENESGYRSLFDIDLTSVQGANDSGRLINKAIDEISTYRAALGAFQKNVVESNLNSLRIADENITQGESTIRDTDMAAEMSKLTGNQILLSASQSMQAQANQLPQNVLQLLQK